MRKFLALGALLALSVTLHSPATAALRVKDTQVNWQSSQRYANSSPTLFAPREAKASARTDTTGVFWINDAKIQSLYGGTGYQSPTAAGAPVLAFRDSMPCLAKFVVSSDSTVIGVTADSLVLTLYAVGFQVNLTQQPNVTTVVDMGSFKGIQVYRATVGGFSTDNTTGTVEIPLLLGAIPGIGTSNLTLTTAANFTFATPIYDPLMGNAFFATVKTVGGTVPQASFHVRYFIDDPTYNGQ